MDDINDVLERFIWIARGLSLAKRIKHLEERWAYYFGFGARFFCKAFSH
jgi:hypothetical protein